jgi:hypothetical protein
MNDKKISGASAEPRIDEIILPDGVKADYTADAPHNSLVGIKRLNAFVGPNNSGKSRLLRELFVTAQNLMVASTVQYSVQIRSAVRSCIDLLPAFESQRNHLIKGIPENLVSAPFGFHETTQHFASFDKQKTEFKQASENLQRAATEFRRHNPPAVSPEIVEQLSTHLRTIYRGIDELANDGKPRHISGQQQPPPEPRLRNAKYIYIPTLRGMRLSSEDESHLHAYFDRTWNDYFKGKRKRTHSEVESIEKARSEYHGKTILTGLDLYEWLTNKLLGGLNDRALVREYQEFLSRTFFQGTPVALIPRREHDTVHIKVGKEKERPVERLGDGMQQLIILTLPIFEHRNVPLFLFIEEPDLFLHPGYQRVFIDSVLSDKERELYVFATTHSSQFLDITVSRDDCSIFRCEKQICDEDGEEHDPKFTVRNTTFGDQSLLKHIGVRPSSVMFANCTVWVEGITDRLYFSRFVELVFKQRNLTYTENLHYAFVEYGGGNITHWSFLDDEGIDVERVCAKLLLIADQDSEKDERHQKLADKLGGRFILLPVRESENLLTPKVITAVIRSYEGADVKLNSFTQSKYTTAYLGKFIDNHVLVDKTKSKRYGKLQTCYADKSGTVKGKVEFCRRSLEQIESIDDMSTHAREIAEKICDFIVQENS